MNGWKAIARCISIRRSIPNQINVGSTYYLADPYDLGEGDIYVSVFSDKHFEKHVGRLFLSHFDVIAATDEVNVSSDVHSEDAMLITTFALADEVKSFLNFMNIWSEGNTHEDGTTSYEIMCADFVKSEEFYNVMKAHGVKVNKQERMKSCNE